MVSEKFYILLRKSWALRLLLRLEVEQKGAVERIRV